MDEVLGVTRITIEGALTRPTPVARHGAESRRSGDPQVDVDGETVDSIGVVEIGRRADGVSPGHDAQPGRELSGGQLAEGIGGLDVVDFNENILMEWICVPSPHVFVFLIGVGRVVLVAKNLNSIIDSVMIGVL